MSIYHELRNLIDKTSAAQVEAVRAALESAAEPLRGGADPETSPIGVEADPAMVVSVGQLFSSSISSKGLVVTCVEARRALNEMLETLGVA